VRVGRFVGDGKLVREGRASASRSRDRCRQGVFWVFAIKAGSRSSHQGGSQRVRDRAIKADVVEVRKPENCDRAAHEVTGSKSGEKP